MKPLNEITLPELRKLVRIRERIQTLENQASRIAGGTTTTPKRTVRRVQWSEAKKRKHSLAMRRVWRNRRNNVLTA